ncbi:MAG: hypothetical protein IJ870_06745 [Alphaproteobacteria bacterium]|nr:hypothetical protein [Alphaproteobacteria bacterium]
MSKALNLAKEITKDMQQAMKLLKSIRAHIGDKEEFNSWRGKLTFMRTGKTYEQFRENNKAVRYAENLLPLAQGGVALNGETPKSLEAFSKQREQYATARSR